MTRQVVLDTETTGLDWRQGDRVIEIGCIELVDRRPTGRRFHRYVNPERPIGAGAQAVHGITDEFLADKPKFAEIADELLDFIREAEVIIHNAAFDEGFLNYELERIGRPRLKECCLGIVDTLKMAKESRPGRKNSLDALCLEYGIDNSGRQLHGALLDAELLAEVYLAMTRGQESLMIELDAAPLPSIDAAARARRTLRVRRASAEELAAHAALLAELDRESKGQTIWRRYV